jgi:ubiquinone/menaquinone biosynthesis C-methylase UbiE
MIHTATRFGDARTVLNVGAGAGSYAPDDRYVIAVEPSAGMRAQRPAQMVPAIDARAEDLPFDDRSFEAAMAAVTVHQWTDTRRGLAELRRVARGPVVVLTFDGDARVYRRLLRASRTVPRPAGAGRPVRLGLRRRRDCHPLRPTAASRP